MDDNNKPITLDGDEALALWRQGREAWNQWANDHPEAYVSFRGVDFAKERERLDDPAMISFERYKFPKGTVDFGDANFGDGDVCFSKANFGDGHVSFHGATFGIGEVIFMVATFGHAGVSFNYASFGSGNVTFGRTNFGGGHVSFCGTTFRDGNADFVGANFGDGNVTFNHATFGNGYKRFDDVTFSHTSVTFIGVTFGNGNVTFTRADFGDGEVLFNRSTFGRGDVRFKQAHFKGHISFQSLNNEGLIKNFTFRHAIFEKSLDLSENTFNCVVDLTNTKMANQVSLEGVKCLVTKATTDKSDIARLRRLKEIAEINKSHKQALAFHADEMRVMRWHDKTMGRAASVLDWLFDEMSDYGQSIIRPVELIIVVSLGFFLLYLSASDNLNSTTIFKAIDLTTANMLPFLPSAKPIIMSSLNALYQTSEAGSIPVWYNLASLLQSFVIFVLLFLIGLGIRNRFRI